MLEKYGKDSCRRREEVKTSSYLKSEDLTSVLENYEKDIIEVGGGRRENLRLFKVCGSHLGVRKV